MKIKAMRSEKEVLDLIVDVAKNDEDILAVMMSGSRANPDIPKDKYQDFDITYFVKDIKPFYDNTEWVKKHFGQPLIMQMPEKIDLIPPMGDGHFTWLMIFDDGIRIDLSVEFEPYIDDGEPVKILLDKSSFFPKLKINDKHWHIKKPGAKHYYDCCNEFWWCLNNVAKGIIRDELPYAMNMYNCVVRPMLDKMVEWYIGMNYDYSVSAGKDGKYFKKYLSFALYDKYMKTYSDSDYNNFWNSISNACDLFRFTAEGVAQNLNIAYNKNEEEAMIKYLNMIKEDFYGK